VEELFARDAAETVACGRNGVAFKVDIDGIPMVEAGKDGVVGGEIGLGEIVEGLVGEDHAPAEGVVRAVALYDGNLSGGLGLFHEQGEVETGRASTDTCDAQGEMLLSFSPHSLYIV